MVEHNNTYKVGRVHTGQCSIEIDSLPDSHHVIWFPHQQTSEIRRALSLRQGIREQQEQSCFQREIEPGDAPWGHSSREPGMGYSEGGKKCKQLQEALQAGVRQRHRRNWALRPVFNWCSQTYGQKGWVEAPSDAAQDDQDLLVPSGYWQCYSLSYNWVLRSQHQATCALSSVPLNFYQRNLGNKEKKKKKE